MGATPSAAELYRWGGLDERRRRRARGVGRLLGPAVVSLLAAVGVAALVATQLRGGDPGGAVRWALAAIATANIVVVFGAPYRMYWRTDSALLGRLPIPGGVLFRLALRRSLRATCLALLPSIAGPAAIAAVGGDGAIEVALKPGIIALASAAMAGLLAPAACLAAGNIVASEKAQAVLESLGGEMQAPRVSWLGTLPGLVATAVALLGIVKAEWTVCAIAIAASLLALGWSLAVADRVLLLAQREIAALDQERLAHIDRSTASPLERAWGAVFAAGSARSVYDKDAAMMRRRYPAPYFVGVLGIGLTWICAATGEEGTAVVVLFSLAAYALVMARRLGAPPVEHPRLLRSLPLAPGAAARAKRAAALLRAVLWCGAAGAGLVTFADDVAVAAGLAGAALVIAAIGGIAVAGGDR